MRLNFTIAKLIIVGSSLYSSATAHLRGSGDRVTKNYIDVEKVRHLTLDEFDDIWTSEAIHYHNNDSLIWEAMNEVAWSDLSGFDDNDMNNAGFIICSTAPLDGYARKLSINSKFLETSESSRNLALQPLYNALEKSCFLTYLNLHEVEVVSDMDIEKNLIIHPMNLLLTMRYGVSCYLSSS